MKLSTRNRPDAITRQGHNDYRGLSSSASAIYTSSGIQFLRIPGTRVFCLSRFASLSATRPRRYGHRLPAQDLQFVEVALNGAAVGTCSIDLEVDQHNAGTPAEVEAGGCGGIGEGPRFRIVEFHPVMRDDISDTVCLYLDVVPLPGRPVLRVAGDVRRLPMRLSSGHIGVLPGARDTGALC